MAVVSRKLRQLQRLRADAEHVREELRKLGINVDADGRGLKRPQSQEDTAPMASGAPAACSDAGAMLRRCANLRKKPHEADIASNRR